MHELLALSVKFLQIAKEDRPGPEVAKEILAQTKDQVSALKALVAEKLELLAALRGDGGVASVLIMILAGFMPMNLELLSDSVKACTPNMKKKKDPSFDELKSGVIKPLKEVVTSVKDFFAGAATLWTERAQVSLFPAEDATAAVDFAKAITDNADILGTLENKRIQQLNKEHAATVARFKDLNEKAAKRYQSLAQ